MDSKLTVKTPERPYLRGSDVFIIKFEQICHVNLLFTQNGNTE